MPCVRAPHRAQLGAAKRHWTPITKTPQSRRIWSRRLWVYRPYLRSTGGKCGTLLSRARADKALELGAGAMHRHTAVQLPWRPHTTVAACGQRSARPEDVIAGLASELDRKVIKYFLDGGPLIGAVRHMSIIPFDKDADFGILSEDMMKMSF